MALLWLCLAVILLVLLVFVWAMCAAAGAEEPEWDEICEPSPTPVPTNEPLRVIYPGIPLADGFIDYMYNICREYDVDLSLVLAIIERESDYDAKLVADNGQSYGLMQIQPQWHRERMARLGVTDLLDPAQNVRVGIDYLSELIAIGKGEAYAVMFYNGGEIHANQFHKRGSMSHYCSDVMSIRDRIMDSAIGMN